MQLLKSSTSTKHSLLDCNRLGQVSWEVDVQSLCDREPVSDQLQWNDVQETLQAVNGLWNLDTFGLGWREFRVVLVADDNWAAITSNDYAMLVLFTSSGEI